MAKETKRLKLTLPEGKDYYDIEVHNSNAKAIEDALYAPDMLPSGNTIYYGSVDECPAAESEIAALKESNRCNIPIEAGRYCIASKTEIRKIRDCNYLDNTGDFTASRVGQFYVYIYNHRTSIPMEFYIYF